MTQPYPKRLIEVDLPIARISAHARREKSIRHGHISTLHIWWARRPLAACRAVICASLWPDPADPLCPKAFREAAVREIVAFARKAGFICLPEKERPKFDADSQRLEENLSPESRARWYSIARGDLKLDPANDDDMPILRLCLLDFIADFANWDNSTVPAYLETSRALTQAAHEALGGVPGTRPLVVDPFAGGGSIPLEALRVGADAFASDLNPIPVLLNKVVLEYIPKYGQRLADEIRKWGTWIKEEAKKELAEFYPKDPDGATPIAYLWARTVLSEAPGQGNIPVEVPLIRSMWLSKKAGRKRALRWQHDVNELVKTETIDVTYYEDDQTHRKKVQRPQLEIFEPKRDSEVGSGTVGRGSVTCPITGYTTKVDSVRAQLKRRRGGGGDARLFAVVSARDEEQGRFYREPSRADIVAFEAAATELDRRIKNDSESRDRKERQNNEGIDPNQGGRRSLVPDEEISLNEIRRISVPIYGMERWGDLFSPRQSLALTTLVRLVRESGTRIDASNDEGLREAVQTCLAMAVDRIAEHGNTLGRWNSTGQKLQHAFGRQAIGMVWDFCEPFAVGTSVGSWDNILECVLIPFETAFNRSPATGHVEQVSATKHPLPNDAAAAFITDPPYYDSVPYAYLSDFFYVWMRRTLADIHPALFRKASVPKDAEIVVDRPHQLSSSTKDISFYERELSKAFAEGRRITQPDGVGTIVFASKSTASWEAILKAVVDAGWVITGSWPLDTEMETRVSAQGQARLASSVHLVCRPREDASGAITESVGEWRDVIGELPKRIHEWMPRLATEGVVGADAIFACLGPALEIFSRYSRVEKSSGETATLREYLEHIWGAVSTEALSLIFKDANAAGLEPDARLTAMWLWTLGGGSPTSTPKSKSETNPDDEEAEADDEEDSVPAAKGKLTGGFTLEYDAARKIAQGLGVHLEQCATLVEVKGDKARLLPVSERTQYLFGKGAQAATSGGPRKKKVQQKNLFDQLDEATAEETGWTEITGPAAGSTILDRVHQAMILFAANRGELLKRFLVEDGIGKDSRFWKLADNLNKLYPPGTEERRWIEGVLARKKGLGL